MVVLRHQSSSDPSWNSDIKLTTSPSRYHNLSNDFEFARWGTIKRLEPTKEQIRIGDEIVQADRSTSLPGPWVASAVAANEVFGSVFYAFPAVVIVAGVLWVLRIVFVISC
jgi:hypothetical protein